MIDLFKTRRIFIEKMSEKNLMIYATIILLAFILIIWAIIINDNIMLTYGIGLIVLISFLCHVIVIDNGIIKFIIECLLCIIIPNLTFYIIFRKSNEFKYIIEKVNFRNLFFNKGK